MILISVRLQHFAVVGFLARFCLEFIDLFYKFRFIHWVYFILKAWGWHMTNKMIVRKIKFTPLVILYNKITREVNAWSDWNVKKCGNDGPGCNNFEWTVKNIHKGSISFKLSIELICKIILQPDTFLIKGSALQLHDFILTYNTEPINIT